MIAELGHVHSRRDRAWLVLGAFTSQDTSSYLASPANGNRYAYAADNPANYTDPTGNDFWSTLSNLKWEAASTAMACWTGAITLSGYAAPYAPLIDSEVFTA